MLKLFALLNSAISLSTIASLSLKGRQMSKAHSATLTLCLLQQQARATGCTECKDISKNSSRY